MPNENDALREQFLALMAAAPMCDYSAEPGAQARVGRVLATLAEKRWIPRRDYLMLVRTLH